MTKFIAIDGPYAGHHFARPGDGGDIYVYTFNGTVTSIPTGRPTGPDAVTCDRARYVLCTPDGETRHWVHSLDAQLDPYTLVTNFEAAWRASRDSPAYVPRTEHELAGRVLRDTVLETLLSRDATLSASKITVYVGRGWWRALGAPLDSVDGHTLYHVPAAAEDYLHIVVEEA